MMLKECLQIINPNSNPNSHFEIMKLKLVKYPTFPLMQTANTSNNKTRKGLCSYNQFGKETQQVFFSFSLVYIAFHARNLLFFISAGVSSVKEA